MPFLTQGKTNWKYILILLILAVIVSGGIFGYLKYFEREIESLPKFPEIKKPEKIVKDETANWKTYRNEEYGFEVKYPEDWFVREDTFTKEIYFGEKGEVMGAGGEKIPIEKIGFSVAVYSDVSELWGNEEGLSLEDWIYKTFLPSKENEVIQPIIFGVDNYKGFLVKKYKQIGVDEIYPTVYVQIDSKVYEIKGEVPTLPGELFPTKYDYDKIFYQMLSTFRFIETKKPEYEEREKLKKFLMKLDNAEYISQPLFLMIKKDFDKDRKEEIFTSIWYGRPQGSILRLIEEKEAGYFIKDRKDVPGGVYHIEVKDIPKGYQSIITDESACFGTDMGCELKTIYTYIDGKMIETWRGTIKYFVKSSWKTDNSYNVQFKDIDGDGDLEIFYTGEEREEKYDEQRGNWEIINEKLIEEIYKWNEKTKRYEKI